jgi:hypothetical protein
MPAVLNRSEFKISGDHEGQMGRYRHFEGTKSESEWMEHTEGDKVESGFGGEFVGEGNPVQLYSQSEGEIGLDMSPVAHPVINVVSDVGGMPIVGDGKGKAVKNPGVEKRGAVNQSDKKRE